MRFFSKKNIFLLLSFVVLFYCNNTRKARLDWDVFGYYLYLPAQFIYHDIALDKKDVWLNPLIEKYNCTDGFYQANIGPKNKYVMKYTMGLAFVYAPFFFVADFIAPKFGYPRDGFSSPYQFMMMLGSIFYSLLGIFYCFKILKLFFSETVSFISVALIVFGTNYFVMTAFDGLMPHNASFTVFAVLLYFSIRWYETKKIKHILIAGICFGLASLIRPTNCIVAIVPLLWGVGNRTDFKNRIILFKKHALHLFIFFGVSFLVVFPQLLYWKSTAGEWFFYSYPNEKLNFFTPHWSAIFSYKKGWLLYTPLMVVAIAGFVNLFLTKRNVFYAIFIFFILNTYLICCWDCWWYGGSFAQRPFVESYVFMLFPLATFISDVSTKNTFMKISSAIIFSFLVFLNLFQTHQALEGILSTTQTTKEYYWKVFLKNSTDEELMRWQEPPENANSKDDLNPSLQYKTVYSDSLDVTDCWINADSVIRVTKPIFIPTTLEYDGPRHYLVSELYADTSSTNTSNDLLAYVIITIDKKGVLYKKRYAVFDFEKLKTNNGKIKLSALIPPQANSKDFVIKTDIYFEGNKKIKILSFTAKVLTKE